MWGTAHLALPVPQQQRPAGARMPCCACYPRSAPARLPQLLPRRWRASPPCALALQRPLACPAASRHARSPRPNGTLSPGPWPLRAPAHVAHRRSFSGRWRCWCLRTAATRRKSTGLCWATRSGRRSSPPFSRCGGGLRGAAGCCGAGWRGRRAVGGARHHLFPGAVGACAGLRGAVGLAGGGDAQWEALVTTFFQVRWGPARGCGVLWGHRCRALDGKAAALRAAGLVCHRYAAPGLPSWPAGPSLCQPAPPTNVFAQELYRMHGLPLAAPLLAHLQAGLSSLKTPASYEPVRPGPGIVGTGLGGKEWGWGGPLLAQDARQLRAGAPWVCPQKRRAKREHGAAAHPLAHATACRSRMQTQARAFAHVRRAPVIISLLSRRGAAARTPSRRPPSRSWRRRCRSPSTCAPSCSAASRGASWTTPTRPSCCPTGAQRVGARAACARGAITLSLCRPVRLAPPTVCHCLTEWGGASLAVFTPCPRRPVLFAAVLLFLQ